MLDILAPSNVFGTALEVIIFLMVGVYVIAGGIILITKAYHH